MERSASPHLTLSPAASQRPATDIRIFAIDIGSNSIRQTIADVSPTGAIRVVDEMKAAPRLGAGLYETGALNEIAIQNALIALSRMATLGAQLGVKHTEVVATSAVRDADNGEEFLQRVRTETGLKIRILRGEDEARLAFRSALAHFDLGAGRAVVMDIGGGSLELALSDDGLVERLISLPLGAIHMSERYLGRNARKKDMKALRKHVRDELRRNVAARHWHSPRIFCSGGTFTSLASVYLARIGMGDAKTVHGTVIPRGELEHIIETLHSMSLAERQTVPGLNAARADIIVGGLAVAAEVAARIEAKELVVSAYGIREGILLESAHVSPAATADSGEARERSVLQLAERSHYEAPHSQHVQKLALQLFDAVGQRLGAKPEERKLLADAALLHDIGYHISYDKHNKHSYHLIEHAELLGMTPEDQVIVANVARYHRGAEPKKKQRNYGGLEKPMRQTIKRLSAILRVADGFDRGHAAAVAEIKVRWMERALRLTAVPARNGNNLRLELWGASRKSNLLSELAGVPVEIVAPDGSVTTYDDEVGT